MFWVSTDAQDVSLLDHTSGPSIARPVAVEGGRGSPPDIETIVGWGDGMTDRNGPVRPNCSYGPIAGPCLVVAARR